MFFPTPGDRASGERAKAVCRRCPVQEACGEYAVTRRIRKGIWGGVGEKERVNLIIAHNRRAVG